jgi:electron transfer flavoprotein alpha subunit
MSILVWIEQRDGQVRPLSREVLGAAAKLAETMGGPVVGVCCAAADPGLASLGESGAQQVLLATDARFARYDADGCAAAVVAAIESVKPAAVLFAASAMGKDLAPRVAGRLGVGMASDCTALAVEGGALQATRPVFAGKAVQTLRFAKSPAIATLRPKMFAAISATGAAAVTPLALSLEPARARVVAMAEAGGGKVDLTEAEVIVAGGRGLKAAEHFALLEALAATLGGSVGASRAVVDAGWRPHSEQVGQTGKTVAPKLYIAAGVSGAIQHLAGMTSSRCIVAINKDPEAPIFKVADYGIVGDLFEVVPALTAAVEKLDAAG